MGCSLGRGTAVLTAALLLSAPAAAHAARATAAPGALDSGLAALVRADARGQSVAAAADARELAVTPGERVLVEVHATPGRAIAGDRLERAGADVRATAAGAGGLSVASAWVPVDELAALARVPGVRAVLPVHAGGTDAGAVLSQGDAAHNGPAARLLGPTGAGIKVGVISDSINKVGSGVAGSQASGDLPASVSVLSDHAGQSDEGRAMAEIVYDTAPGITQMAFASGTAAGAAGKAAAIDALVADGAKIIADDIFYLSEPFFQDGQVAQAVDRARAAGVLYLASAGNRARQSHESAPRFPAGDEVPHDFDAGAPTDTTQTLVTVPNNRFVQVALQWDEAWGSAQTDIDVEIVRASDNAPLASGITDNLTTTLPSEVATWSNTTGSAVTVGLRIVRYTAAPGAPAPTTLKYIARGNFGSFSVAEHDTASDTINPDAAAAAGSLAVAAVEHGEPGLDDPESFSSRGPKTRLFDRNGTRLVTPEVRQKPELAAADGVNTTVPGFQPFFGTSAAVPSAAGVAALAWSAIPGLAVAAIREAMTNAAHGNDCTLAGLPDADCGFGFMLADRVVASLDGTPPAVEASVPAPDGENGWHHGAVPVSWSATDAQTPTQVLSGCASTTVAADGVTTLSCRAGSVGGTTERSVTIRRDATPPDVPAITGISAATYTTETVPAAAAVACAAGDATSGAAGCVVSGHRGDTGTHTLTATARDIAGNTRTATLAYTVIDPPRTATPAAVRPRDLVTLPAAKACVRRTRRLRVRVAKPAVGAVRRVRIRITGRKRATTARRHGTITLPRITRTRVTVSVTVTLTDGRSATVRRTYRRC
jgi:hypothetical protein